MLGLYVVADALRNIGLHVERKTDHFDEDTPDPVWLPEVGRRGWIVLTSDKRLVHNHLEIVSLLKANTHSFVLTSGSFTGRDMANAFVNAVPQMLGIIKRMPPPVICSVHKNGDVKVRHMYDDLAALAVAKHSALLPGTTPSS